MSLRFLCNQIHTHDCQSQRGLEFLFNEHVSLLENKAPGLDIKSRFLMCSSLSYCKGCNQYSPFLALPARKYWAKSAFTANAATGAMQQLYQYI